MRKAMPWFLAFMIVLVFLVEAMIFWLHQDKMGKAMICGAGFVMILACAIVYTTMALIQHMVIPLLMNSDKPHGFRPRLAIVVPPTTDLDEISYGPYTFKIEEGLQDREGLSFHVDGKLKGVRDDVRTITDANSFLEEMAREHQIPVAAVADLRIQLAELFGPDAN